MTDPQEVYRKIADLVKMLSPNGATDIQMRWNVPSAGGALVSVPCNSEIVASESPPIEMPPIDMLFQRGASFHGTRISRVSITLVDGRRMRLWLAKGPKRSKRIRDAIKGQQLLSVDAVAKMVSAAPHDISTWVYLGTFPAPIKINEYTKRWRLSDLKEWIAKRTHKATREIKKRKRRHIEQSLYFIQSGKSIKIGIAVDPESRLRGLQTGSPEKLKLLHVMPGGKRLEGKLHERFKAHRLSGEWFRDCQEIRMFIAENGGDTCQ